MNIIEIDWTTYDHQNVKYFNHLDAGNQVVHLYSLCILTFIEIYIRVKFFHNFSFTIRMPLIPLTWHTKANFMRTGSLYDFLSDFSSFLFSWQMRESLFHG